MRYVFYSLDTGEITGFSEGEGVTDAWAGQGCGAAEATLAQFGNPSAHYVVGGVVTPRPAMPASLDKTSIQATGLDKATISAIPAGATAAVVDVNGRSDYTISDGLLEITADVAGEILVTLNLWPFLEARFEITAA